MGFKGHNQFVCGVAIVTYEFLSANIISSLMNRHTHTHVHLGDHPLNSPPLHNVHLGATLFEYANLVS